MFKVADRIKESSLTAGTGSVVLNGAINGFQTFLNGIGDGNSTFYAIENESQWEVGVGTYTASTNSLSRDVVYDSSNSGNKISLVRVSTVFCTYPAGQAIYENNEGKVSIGRQTPSYQLDVLGSGRFDTIVFGDGTTQSSSPDSYLTALVASGVAISGWAKYYVDHQDHSASAVSGMVSTSYLPYSGAIKNTDMGNYGLTAISGNFSNVSINTQATTYSSPALNVNQTWNSSPTVFTAIKSNITDMASSASSLLMDLQVGGTSLASINKSGFFYAQNINANASNWSYLNASATVDNFWNGAGVTIKRGSLSQGFAELIYYTGSTREWTIGTGAGSTNLFFAFGSPYIEVAKLLKSDTGYKGAFHLYNTSDNGNNYERGVIDWITTSNVLRIGTEAAGTGTVRNIALVGGNVGIGTTGPSYSLTVGSGTITPGGFGGSDAKVRALISDTTSAKYTQLAIQGPSNGGAAIQIYDGSGNAVADFGMNTVASDFGFINRKTSGVMQFYTHDGTSLAPRIYIGSTGLIGINTTSPTARLTIVGGTASLPASSGTQQSSGHIVRLNDSTAAILDMGSNAANGFWLQSTDKNSLSTNYPLLLNPNGGNVGISTTSPAAKLDILDTTGAGSGSLAASILNLAQTWNTTGTPTALKLNVTDTASNAASLLMDLQVGGSSRFKVGKDGHIYGGSTVVGISNSIVLNAASTYTMVYSANVAISDNGSFRNVWIKPSTSGIGEFLLAGGMLLGWSDSNGNAATTTDLVLRRDAANTLALRNGTNQQRFNLYGTWDTNGTNYRRLYLDSTTAGAFKIGAEGLGTGATGNTLDFQCDGTTRFKITSDGATWFGLNSGNSGFRASYDTLSFYYVGNELRASLQLSGAAYIRTMYSGSGFYINDTTGILYFGNGSNTRQTHYILPQQPNVFGGYTAPGYHLIISGGKASTNAPSGSGGDLSLKGGDAVLGDFAGGNVYLDGGQPFGSGANGNIIIGNTRGKLGISNTTPLAKLDIADTWNSNITVTGASGNGTTATLTFSAITNAIAVGSTIVVASVNPSGYNGTFTVTASTTTSVSYANTTTGAYVSGGNIKQLFTALKVNVTDTSSDAGSLLADFQVGGSSQFQFTKNRQLYINSYQSGYNGQSNYEGFLFYGGPQGGSVRHGLTARYGSASNGIMLWALGVGYAGVANWGAWFNSQIGFSANDVSYSNPDTFLARDAANTLAQRKTFDTVHYAQAYRLYNKYSDVNNWERAVLDWQTTADVLRIGTEAGGSGTVRNIALVGGNVGIGTTSPSVKVTVDNGANFGTIMQLTTSDSTGGYLRLTAGTRTVRFGADGSIGPHFGSTQFGGVAFLDAGQMIPIFGLSASNGSCDIGRTDLRWRTLFGNNIDLSGQSLTGTSATSLLELAATWNTTGTPTAFKLNVTDTASNAASLLMDLQVGGSSKFSVNKLGAATLTTVNISGSGYFSTQASTNLAYVNAFTLFQLNASDANNSSLKYMRFDPQASIQWGNNGAGTVADLIILRDATGTLAQRNSTNAQTYRIYNTYTNDSNYERAKIAWESNVLKIGTEGLGTGAVTPRSMEFQTNGTTRLTIDGSTGAATFTQTLTVLGGSTTTHDTTYFSLQAPGGTVLIRGKSTYGRADLDLGQASGYVTFVGPVAFNSSINASGFSISSVPFCNLNGPFSGVNFFGRDGSTAAGGDIHIRSGNPASGVSSVIINSDAGLLVQNRANNAFSTLSASSGYFYNTYTNDSNYERAKIAWESNVLRIGTEGLGTGAVTPRSMEFQTAGTTRLSIATNGTIYTGAGTTAANQIYCVGLNAGGGNIANNGNAGTYYIGSIGSYFFKNGGDGIVELCGSGLTGTGFGRLQLGGTTSSFPAIKRNSAALNFRLADDSADCDITAANATFSGALTATSKSFLIDHPSKPGMKLQYGSLESPYHGVRITGEGVVTSGYVKIDLPDYMCNLIKTDGINIQLTAIGHYNNMCVGEVNSQYFTVLCNSNEVSKFYWTFTAIRKDIEDLVVEIN